MSTTSPRAVLALVLLGQFLVVLDVSIVNVALPSIQGDLGYSDTGLQWVVNAYTIAFAGFLLLGGRLADIFGHRRAFAAGLALFTLGSLIGGLAPSAGVLTVGRVVQGLGGAVLSPATLTILTTTFPEGPQRAKALAWWMAIGAAGGAVGSLAGGVLTQWLSWRWVLLVNAPIAFTALVAALRTLPVDHTDLSTDGRRLDVPGAAMVTAGLALVVLGVVDSVAHGWGAAATLGPLAGGVVLLAGFVAVERRLGSSALVPLGVLGRRSIAASNVVMILTGSATFAIWYFVSLYEQHVLGFGAIAAGAGFLPHTLAIVAGTQITTRVLARRDPRVVASVGLLISAVGFFWQSQAGADGTYLANVLGPGVVLCFGSGLAFAPIAAAATNGVERPLAGLASGLLNASRMLGSALGLAALTTIAAGASTQVDGFDRAFAVAAAVLVAAALLAWLLPAPRRERAVGGVGAQATRA